MGYLSKANAIEAYRQIRRSAVGRVCSILILAAPTVDALCALKILTQLLMSDFLAFKVVPVAGYDDIVAANDNFLQGRNEIRTVVLLDCGGMVDLGEFLSLSPDMTVYLFDSHRPYSLVNIFGNAQLTIVDDGSIEGNLECLKDAFEGTKLAHDDIQDLEAYSESDDAESRSASDAEADGEDENADPNRASRRGSAVRKSDRAYKRDCCRKMAVYYQQGSFYGASIAHIMFGIADDLAKSNNNHLWYAVLGVTYQHLLELRSEESYGLAFEDLREACLRANPRGANPELESRDGLIRPEEEFRFMLMRHWTLFNAMFHSRYVASRMNVWREKGRRLLETFIVKMGLPLHQCTRDYGSMDLEFKESLPSRLAKHAADFGIEECVFNSFVRDFGYVIRLSASDAVYSLMALIEAPSAESSAASLFDAEASSPDTALWIRNFYTAFEALDYSATAKLKHGIQLAMKQQQVIIHEASTIISHRQVRTGRRFRYVVLRHSSDLAWLSSHPVSLSKLALLLVEALRNNKKARLPLVLAAFQPQSQLYQVVATNGYRPRPDDEDYNLHEDEEDEQSGFHDQPFQFRNHFGVSFRQAAQQIRARVKHDGFETSVIEVSADDLKQFLHVLQTIPSPRSY